MNYLIYFDESNKLISLIKRFSYYGANSGTDTSLAMIVNMVRKIFKETNSTSELHFREYKKDSHLKWKKIYCESK